MKENKQTNNSKEQENEGVSRRGFIASSLFVGAGLAADSLSFAASQNQADAQTGNRKNDTKAAANSSPGRRKLSKLEVSAVGMGVQNMGRKYETTVPPRNCRPSWPSKSPTAPRSASSTRTCWRKCCKN